MLIQISSRCDNLEIDRSKRSLQLANLYISKITVLLRVTLHIAEYIVPYGEEVLADTQLLR